VIVGTHEQKKQTNKQTNKKANTHEKYCIVMQHIFVSITTTVDTKKTLFFFKLKYQTNQVS
jgi:hypothetical protein